MPFLLSLLFPYTTLFRSDPLCDRVGNRCERVKNGFRKGATCEQRHHSYHSIFDKQRVSGEGNHSVILCPIFIMHARIRSEEHTSELQSLRHLVCRLLLEK